MKLLEKQSQKSEDNRVTVTAEDRMRSGLFRSIAGVGIGLVIMHAIALIGWQPHRLIVAPPWLFATVDSWLVFAATCVALFAFGRFRVLRDPVSYWICTGFTTFAIGWVFRILAWPGLLPNGGAIICHLPYTSATIGLWAMSMLAIALLLSALGHWPRDKALRGSRGLWSVAGWLVFAVLVNVLMVVFEQSLPALPSARGGWTPFALTWTYLNALMFASGLALSTRRYLLTGDTLPAYTACAQVTLGLFSFTLGPGGNRYDLLTFVDRVLCIPGFWTMAFGLLTEYVHLFRREQAESRQLKEAEEKYHDIFDNALEGIFETTPQGQFLTANPALAKMLGYGSPEELTSSITDSEHQVWVDPNERLKYVQLIETLDVVLGYECELKRKDGTKFWVSLNTRSVPWQDGRTLFYSGFLEDITERRQAEEIIRKSDAKYRRLYESMRDGFVLVTMDGTITEFNQSFREMTGYTRKELLTLTYRDLTPEKWHDLETKIIEEQILTRGYSDPYEKEYRRKDGTLFPVGLRTFLLKGEQGKNTGMWAIVRDITERKRAEEALLERLRFEKLLSSIAGRLANVSPDEMDREIRDALQAIADFFQVSQCVLTKGYPGEMRAVVTHAARAISGSPTAGGVDVVSLFPWTSEAMLRGDVVRFTALGDLPAEAAADRQTYWKLGIRSILSIPLSFEGSMAYAISIASLEEERAWPEEYIPRLQLIGETLVNTIERKQAAAALEERLKFETLLADLSARFVVLATDQVDRQIEDAQRWICELLGLERSTFWQVSYADSANSILLAHSYQSSGATLPRGANARDLFPWAVQKALSGETTSVSTMEDFPPEAARDRDVLHSHGVKSILILPLVAGGGTILGALTFAQVSKERDWPATVVKYLQLIAQTFANALSRKKADDALRESNERFRQVAENIGDFIWEIDAQGLYRYTSPSVKRILGYSPDELIGKMHFYDLFTPEVREELKAAAFRVFAAKQPFRAFSNPNLSKDGRVVHMETSGSPVLDEAGNLTGYIGVDSDVTERQKLEAHLQQAVKMEALGTLTGGIAHDFNNILAAIMGFTELTKEKLPKGSRDERHLQMVMEASLRGRELIKQMLTFSRQMPQEKKPLLLSTIVNETGRFLRASIPSTISIRVNVESESGFVLADPVQVQQVLTNLCTNAAHAMREKGGTLDIALSDFSVSPSNGDPHGIVPGLYMRLTVRDAGVGIPREIVDKIFDPFFTTKKLGEGTGLGLSVVMGIIKQSQGYITVESEPGRGSTFTVYFPKVAEKPLADAAVTDEPIPIGSERILFVDDEEPLVVMGEELLAKLGYEVTSRTSSRQALDLLKQDASRFDLVITDQTMPDMTGVELAREILAIRPQLPVILCTGFSHLVDADSAKTAGIRGFVMKPLTKREIARTVRKVLDG